MSGNVGPYFEDLSAGQTIEHSGGRTILDADNTWFTLLTCNNNEVHYNTDYAAKREFGQILVNSCLTLAVITGLSVADISRNAVNLGWDNVRMPKPVFLGDTLYARSEVLATRPSGSRPGSGIVQFRTTGFKQDGTVVMEFDRTIMIPRREPAASR
jgi:itaconyl-CoA hydratase